jgi:hypothetical protein
VDYQSALRSSASVTRCCLVTPSVILPQHNRTIWVSQRVIHHTQVGLCAVCTLHLDFEYPKPICEFDLISKEQIGRQLARLKPYKAPRPDGIPNIVLTKCADALTNRLLYIYRAMTKNVWYYDPWKLLTTVVLRKPGKPRYNTPKAYRPIALLNTLCKVLTAVVVDLMTFYTERHQLLPANHFGGRPGRTTTDAIHLLVHRIKDTWRKQQVTAVLFLDIEGAFPNAITS